MQEGEREAGWRHQPLGHSGPRALDPTSLPPAIYLSCVISNANERLFFPRIHGLTSPNAAGKHNSRRGWADKDLSPRRASLAASPQLHHTPTRPASFHFSVAPCLPCTGVKGNHVRVRACVLWRCVCRPFCDPWAQAASLPLAHHHRPLLGLQLPHELEGCERPCDCVMNVCRQQMMLRRKRRREEGSGGCAGGEERKGGSKEGGHA